MKEAQKKKREDKLNRHPDISLKAKEALTPNAGDSLMTEKQRIHTGYVWYIQVP